MGEDTNDKGSPGYKLVTVICGNVKVSKYLTNVASVSVCVTVLIAGNGVPAMNHM
jgi:hypothetical protein